MRVYSGTWIAVAPPPPLHTSHTNRGFLLVSVPLHMALSWYPRGSAVLIDALRKTCSWKTTLRVRYLRVLSLAIRGRQNRVHVGGTRS